jgi:hypothetical protein
MDVSYMVDILSKRKVSVGSELHTPIEDEHLSSMMGSTKK